MHNDVKRDAHVGKEGNRQTRWLLCQRSCDAIWQDGNNNDDSKDRSDDVGRFNTLSSKFLPVWSIVQDDGTAII